MGDPALDMRASGALASAADEGFATSCNRFPIFAACHARDGFGSGGWILDMDETIAPDVGMARG
jgi:hypothetical protein